MTYAQTPHGNRFHIETRPEYNDEALVNGILGADEYLLADLHDLEGWALDIGAHVGTVGIALAIDHPKLSVVMVEPVPDNAALIRKSVKANGLQDRCHVVEASAGSSVVKRAICRYGYRNLAGFEDQKYVQQNAMVGNIWRLTDTERVDCETVETPIVTIASLCKQFGIESFVFTKTDCEGCEWDFLRGAVSRLPLIVGEWHDAPFSRVEKRLGTTHVVEMINDYGGSGIFRAVAR